LHRQGSARSRLTIKWSAGIATASLVVTRGRRCCCWLRGAR
jgi:hypothetical protein